MRLDHLLSKENIVNLFCHWVGCLVRRLEVAEFFVIARCWLASGGGKFLFSGEDKYRTYFMCVVLGVDETKRGFFSWLTGWRGFAE